MTATFPTSLPAPVKELLDRRGIGPAIKLVVGYILLVEILLQLFFGRITIPFVELGFLETGLFGYRSVPREVFINGAIIGSLYGLVGMGLIVVYRANRIINFAQAQLGAVPAVAALLLIVNKGWNYFLVLPVLIFGAIALGAIVEKGPITRLKDAPRLILTVATIGVSFVLLVLEFFTKVWLSDELIETASVRFPTPWNDVEFSIGTQIFNGNHIFTVIVVAILMAALTAFFKFTDMGIAVRASAENSDRASLLGIPVRRVSTVVWVIAALMSAVGVFLRAPLVGIPLTGFVGPDLLLFGLAAAVIARMESLGSCMVAGMFIGCVDQGAIFSTNSPGITRASMLVVILLALFLQKGALGRAHDTGVSSFQTVREVRPIPAELRSLPEVVRMRRAVAIAGAVAILLAPFYLGDTQTGLATQMVIYSIVGVSLVVLTGWAGQISLGQWGIAGFAAAVAGGLAAPGGLLGDVQLDFFLILVLASLSGAGIAVLVGLPALRLQGLFLAVTTLAFSSAVSGFVLKRQWFGWLLPDEGTFVERPILYGIFDMEGDWDTGPFTIFADAKFYYLCLVFLGVAMLLAKSLRRNRSGRILIGIRDNQRVMQAFGVDPQRTKLAAFAISGFIAGLGGALFAYQQRSIDASSYAAETSILVFVMTVIGGIGSIPGAVLGAVFVKGVPLLPILRDIDLIDLLVSGAGLLFLLLVMPGGLAEGCYRLRDTFLRKVAADRGIHVPSLVADSLVLDQDAADDVGSNRHPVEATSNGHGPEPLGAGGLVDAGVTDFGVDGLEDGGLS